MPKLAGQPGAVLFFELRASRKPSNFLHDRTTSYDGTRTLRETAGLLARAAIPEGLAVWLEVVEAIGLAGFPVSILAWCYGIYCCNALEASRPSDAEPLALGRWLSGDLPRTLALRRRGFLVSTVVCVWAIVVSRVVQVLTGAI